MKNIISYIAFIISILTLFLVWTRIEPVTIEWMGILVGILSLITTILIGWNIFVVIDFKKNINEAEEKHKSLIKHSETTLLIMYKTTADLSLEKQNIFGLINNSLFAIDIAIKLDNIPLAESLLNRIIEVSPNEIQMNSFYKSMLTTSFYSVKNWKYVKGYKDLENFILNIKVTELSNQSQLDFI